MAENDHRDPVFLSAEELANQFNCKILQMTEAKGIIPNKPVMKLRISGGEPLYTTNQLFEPFTSEKKTDYKLGIDYFTDFFVRIDQNLKELRSKGTIHLMKEDDWNYKQDNPFPTFLTDTDDRFVIRFDTAGIEFGDNDEALRVNGGKAVADYFIDEIFNLYTQDKLNNLKIWITYSLKGTTPQEYYWSQKRNLPASESNNDNDYDIENHPQYSGYENLKGSIDELVIKDGSFADVIDITVEKGIDHDVTDGHNVYMYSPNSMNWDKLSQKAHVELSEVKNDLCIIYGFGGGPWGLHRLTPALIKRYLNRGATLRVESDSKTYYLTENSMDLAREATRFIDEHHLDTNFKIIIKPGNGGDDEIAILTEPQSIAREPEQKPEPRQ
ncbi:MAG: hypothetical protein V3U21_01805, partial [Thermodesulfobacteriota bacterium]